MEEEAARAKVERIRRRNLKKTLFKKREEFEEKLKEAEKRYIKVVRAQTDHVATSNHIGDCTTNGDEEVLRRRTEGLRKCITKCDEALEMVEKGTYGICQECEEGIPIARLEKMPFAALCVPCKNEKNKRIVRAK